MKKIILSLIILAPLSSPAGQAGGGSSPNCKQVTSATKKLLKYCSRDMSNAYCVQKIWPKVKAKHPDCAIENSPLCLDYCTKDLSPSICLDLCG